jgi:hypothetical protein
MSANKMFNNLLQKINVNISAKSGNILIQIACVSIFEEEHYEM